MHEVGYSRNSSVGLGRMEVLKQQGFVQAFTLLLCYPTIDFLLSFFVSELKSTDRAFF